MKKYASWEIPFFKMEVVYKTNGEGGCPLLVTGENYLLQQGFIVIVARFTCYGKDYLLFK